MASIWDTLFSREDYRKAAPQGGYADLYQGGLLARNRDREPMSVEAMRASQDFIPGIGDAIALGEAYDAASRGELVAAGLLGTGAAIGLVPGAGDMVARPIMAAGRKAADLADRIEVDPNALGSMGGNVRLRPAGEVSQGISDAAPTLPAPRNEAEAMAKQVLEMRAAGKAGDVTDDMMALADDQYMFANTPIPMDEASRTGAGRGQDYDPDYFHGTGSDIVGVDPSKLGQKQNVLGEGFYTSKATQRADRYVPKVTDDDGDRIYAEGGNVMPLATRGSGEFDLTSKTGKENVSRIAKAFEGSDFTVDLRDGGDSVSIKSKTDPNMSVFIDSREEGQGTLSRLKSVFGNANLTTIFKEAGFTGLKGAEGAGSTVRVSYEPENVRSRFARFDPEFRHLRNLSAGVGGLGLLSTIPEQEQQPKGLLQ